MIWNPQGTEQQNSLVHQAIAACDFPFEVMRPSLEREGKTSIRVEWADLSRYAEDVKAAEHDDEHEHDHDDGIHAIEREIDGRMRVLGLFYLPPYTKVVLDSSLVNHPMVAQEVFLAEGAHAVDYHWMVHNEGMRLAVWNALHADRDDLPEGSAIHESGDLGHGHSWFDGAAGYSTWVGEAFMEAFIRSFAPSIPVTINLAHPVTAEAVVEIRKAISPAPEPEPEPEPTPEPTPEVEDAVNPPLPPDGGSSDESGSGSVYWSGGKNGKSAVVHDSHKRIEPEKWYASLAEAEADGLRACRVCRPV